MRTSMKNHKALAGGRRRQGTRNEYVRFLIVCEGTETEPNYFKAFVKDRWSEVRTVGPVIKGCAKSTCQLVAEAGKIRVDLEKSRQVPFDHVWLVFDKDDFKDFNQAISEAKKKGMMCAWSNESFELWYCLHFQDIKAALRRNQYIDMIEKCVRKLSKNKDFVYDKASKDFYTLICEHGDELKAGKRAKLLRKSYGSRTDYDKHNPRTEVDLLVDELRNPNKLL